MKKLILSLALAVIAITGYGQTKSPTIVTKSTDVKSAPAPASAPEQYFASGEFELGVASTWTVPDKNFDLSKGVVGVSVSGTKYFNEYAGVTAQIDVVDLYNVGNLVIDQVSLGGTLRYPIGRVAPYARALVGRDFQRGFYKFDAGAGVELRLTKNVGVFTESLYQFSIDNRDSIVFRGGVSLAF